MIRILTLLILTCCLSSALYGADNTAVGNSTGDNFCQECHQKESTAIQEEGLGHQTEVSCANCHQGHKPKSFENIPACNLCHAGTPHYDQLQCLNCHRDPHRPMAIKLPKKAHKECMTCHDSPGVDLAENQSYHSLLVCTDCHYEHAFMPECMSCHNSHGTQMTETDCQSCHEPHKPLEMVFASTEIPTGFCSPCHEQAGRVLAASNKKHRDLSCIECHEQHGRIPDCQSCHGTPHADAMHAKFPVCGDCHGVAHDLQ